MKNYKISSQLKAYTMPFPKEVEAFKKKIVSDLEKDLSNGKNPIKISSNDGKQRKNKH